MTPAALAAAALFAALPVPEPGPVLPAQAETPTLAGTEWDIIELGGVPLTSDPLPRVIFLEVDRFAATAGCNRFSGGYELDGSEIEFPQAIAGTRMACPPPLDQLETDMMAGLMAADEITLAGDVLSFTDDEGVTVMRLRPAR